MLSAIITCYKDARAIPLMHRRLTDVFRSLGVSYEIIFVNDASPDQTDAVLKALTAEDEHVLAIEHSRNFGSQSAFMSGMQVAQGDAVILLDGDLQDPPELISAFHAKWREGNEVVYGRRVKREGSTVMALFASAFYRIFRRVSDVPMPLYAGDFALIDRRVVNELLALPETDQFLRGLRAWVGFRQTGVDYVRPKRAFGRSTHRFLKHVWWARKAIFSFSFAPIALLGYTGVSMTALSSCALVYRIVQTLRYPDVPHGASTVVIVIAFFGSLNLLAIAILGEYLAKVVEEVKRRPKFIRKAIRYGGKHLVTARELEEFQRTRTRDASSAASTPTASLNHES